VEGDARKKQREEEREMKGAKQGVNTHVVRMVAGMRVLDPDKACAENGFGYWFDNV
jgi:hypothetical protein